MIHNNQAIQPNITLGTSGSTPTGGWELYVSSHNNLLLRLCFNESNSQTDTQTFPATWTDTVTKCFWRWMGSLGAPVGFLHQGKLNHVLKSGSASLLMDPGTEPSVNVRVPEVSVGPLALPSQLCTLFLQGQKWLSSLPSLHISWCHSFHQWKPISNISYTNQQMLWWEYR